jgi:hypothetical protein
VSVPSTTTSTSWTTVHATPSSNPGGEFIALNSERKTKVDLGMVAFWVGCVIFIELAYTL